MAVQLNPEQQQVVLHHTGPMRTGAVAGAGKTKTLIERTHHLITKRKVSPSRILLISFSRAAKDEMKRRIEKRMPGLKAGNCVRTFHSIGLMVFQSEIDQRREYEIDSTGFMYLRATEQAYRSINIEPERKAILRFAGLVKNNLIGTDERLRRLGRADPRMLKFARECTKDGETKVSPDNLIHAYLRAEKIRTEGIEHRGQCVRFVTFDDMIYQTAMLLRRQDVRSRWAEKWHFVMQDECQDENEAQAVIAEALASKTRNYVVVGDPAQSIYQFRGADPEHMLRFEERWPEAKTVVMFRNYRSGIEIVDLANRVMESMPARTVITDDYGDSVSMRSERETRAHVGCHVFADSTVEAMAVAKNIKQHHRDGAQYAEQAVLVRMNRMTRDIEVALAKKKIPYKLLSGQSFFLMPEAQVLFGYLGVLSCRADQRLFKACINNPSRKLGNKFIAQATEIHDLVKKDWMDSVSKILSKVASYQRDKAHAWLRFMKSYSSKIEHSPPAELMKDLREALKLDDHFKRNSEEEADSRSSENLDSVIEFATHFSSTSELLDTYESVEKHRGSSSRKKEAVTISTVHKAKGGEWEVVYLMQCAGGWFPVENADINEERRCFYVAVTRAKDELWISRPQIGKKPDGETFKLNQSFFVTEVDLKEHGETAYEVGKKIDSVKVGTQATMSL